MKDTQNKEIWIKNIPGHWDKVKKAVYVIGLGETENEAGRRVIVPYRSSLGKKLNYPGYYVKVLGSKNELVFCEPGTFYKTYKMKLVEKLEGGAKGWVVENIEDSHYCGLENVSITPNELTQELYHNE